MPELILIRGYQRTVTFFTPMALITFLTLFFFLNAPYDKCFLGWVEKAIPEGALDIAHKLEIYYNRPNDNSPYNKSRARFDCVNQRLMFVSIIFTVLLASVGNLSVADAVASRS